MGEKPAMDPNPAPGSPLLRILTTPGWFRMYGLGTSVCCPPCASARHLKVHKCMRLCNCINAGVCTHMRPPRWLTQVQLPLPPLAL